MLNYENSLIFKFTRVFKFFKVGGKYKLNDNNSID